MSLPVNVRIAKDELAKTTFTWLLEPFPLRILIKISADSLIDFPPKIFLGSTLFNLKNDASEIISSLFVINLN